MPRLTRHALVVGAAAAALLTGCSGQQSGTSASSGPDTTTASSTTTPSTTAPSTTVPSTARTSAADSPAAPSITDQAGQDLCQRIEPSLSDWRVQGPTLGKIALKGTALEWAVHNGYASLDLLRDHTVFDTVTTQHCPDVRQQALTALEIPSLEVGIYAL